MYNLSVSSNARTAFYLLMTQMLVVSFSGCSVFKKPGAEPSLSNTVALQGSDSAEVYQRIKEAKSQNSLVLQVTGDSQPIRVLPLPADGRTVFVSDLLRQTGVQEKMGRMLVTVHRSSPADFAGAKMVVKFDREGKAIRPETDYALQAGDRIKVMKDPTSSFGSILEQILPTNATHAIAGY